MVGLVSRPNFSSVICVLSPESPCSHSQRVVSALLCRAGVFHLEVIRAVAVDEHMYLLAELVKCLGIFWDGRCCRNARMRPDAEIHLRDGLMFSDCLIGL